MPDRSHLPPSFSPTLPGVVAATAFGLACLLWLAGGDRLPGGRWIVGRASGAHLPLVLGSLAIMVIVGANLITLRRLRRGAPSDRSAALVRQYEHAHVAFLVAAGLGGARGAGWLPGSLNLGARDAHIHLTVLGWAGLTVPATLTAHGPALLGVRVEAAAAARATRGSYRSALRWSVGAALVWFLIAIGLDITTVVSGLPGWAHGLGTLVLIGVLAQLVLAVLSHVGPTLRGPAPVREVRLGERIGRVALARVGVFNLGVLLLAGGQAIGRITDLPTALSVRLGWVLISIVALSHIAALLAPRPSVGPADMIAGGTRPRRSPDRPSVIHSRSGPG